VGKRKVVAYYAGASVAWFAVTEVVRQSVPTLRNIVLYSRLIDVLYAVLSCVFLYILMRQQKTHEVDKEEHRLSTLMNSMTDFISFKDGEGRWIQVNDFGLRLFQLEHVDYKGKTDRELGEYTEFYRDALIYCEQSDEETWQSGKLTRVEEIIPLPEGGCRIFDTTKMPLFHEDGSRKALIVIGRDITERKNAEKRLAENEQRYKSLFEYNPNLVYMIDGDGKVTNLNAQFEVITGYARESFIGGNLLDLIEEPYRNAIVLAFRKVLAEGEAYVTQEIDIRRKDGTKRTLSCTFVPMMIEQNVVGMIGYSQDITKIRQTEERLRHSELLSTLGELAAGVAHEIRNPLTSLKGFVQLLQKSDLQQAYYYTIMLDELDRINNIVGELLVLAKPQQLVFERESVGQIVKDVLALLQPQANFHGIELVFEEDGLPAIDCEGNQLKQLFINLVKNAFEANATMVKVMIKERDGYISIRVQDNGCGMPPERLTHLGEPFFSVKEKGTGLGLTVSYRIVEAHGGKLTFTSEVGEGTVAEVLLPIKNHTSV
jgi:two-component system, sporulation sensor kinase E